jgi:hypothetical protein
MKPLPLPAPLAIILGVNEIASAVAVYLHRARYRVVLSNDPLPPVMRRGMAFYDALFEDSAIVDGIAAARIEQLTDVFSISAGEGYVAVTMLGLTDLLILGPVALIIDARMQKRSVTPSLCRLADMTIGLGPGFTAKLNCDVAIETHPSRNGTILYHGRTQDADGQPSELGGAGRERFVYSPVAGRWRTAFDVGIRVFRGLLLGRLDNEPITAPIDGTLRGIVRDGVEVPADTKLIEIDPRPRDRSWNRIDQRSHIIARAVMRAIHVHQAQEELPGVLPGIYTH